jgi:hypothetical protein
MAMSSMVWGIARCLQPEDQTWKIKGGSTLAQSVNIPMTLRIENKAKLIGQA